MDARLRTRPVSGLTVGLLGGSFDPPHRGHLHISHIALRRLRLDRIWWLLTPGNPLKEDQPASIARRAAAARALIDHPQIEISDIETRIGTRYTADTIHKLNDLFPHTRFVWLMGADNLAGFHRWQDWPEIMMQLPIAVFSRPGQQIRAGLSPAAQRFARARVTDDAAPVLARMEPPCWTLITHPLVRQSSTALRAQGSWR